jgi:hypothetical protein
MEEINRLFKEAMVVFFRAPRHKNDLPTIGIGFSNNDKPERAKKLLKLVGTNFILRIIRDQVRIKLTVLNDKDIVCEAELNYNAEEFNVFKEVVSNASKGTLVLGTFINCQFYIINQRDVAESLNLEVIEFIE